MMNVSFGGCGGRAARGSSYGHKAPQNRLQEPTHQARLPASYGARLRNLYADHYLGSAKLRYFLCSTNSRARKVFAFYLQKAESDPYREDRGRFMWGCFRLLLKIAFVCGSRPEGAKAPSPGQRPGASTSEVRSPCKGKSTNRIALCIRAFALTGRENAESGTNLGRCPRLGAFAPSGRFCMLLSCACRYF